MLSEDRANFNFTLEEDERKALAHMEKMDRHQEQRRAKKFRAWPENQFTEKFYEV